MNFRKQIETAQDTLLSLQVLFNMLNEQLECYCEEIHNPHTCEYFDLWEELQYAMMLVKENLEEMAAYIPAKIKPV